MRRVAELVVAVLAVAAACLTFREFYGSVWWLPGVLGALVTGVALAALATLRRWPGWVLAPVSLAVLFVLVLYVAYPGTTSVGIPGLESVRSTADGLVSGWARMLTVALPADASGDVLAFPMALAYVAGLATTLLVLGTRWRAAPALPALVVLGVGLAYTVQRPERGLLVTVVTVGLVLLLLLVRADATAVDRTPVSEASTGPRLRRPVVGRFLLGLPGAALVLVLATVATTTLPLADGDDRADPREAYPDEVELRPALSPLVQVQPQLREDTPAELYRIRPTYPGGDVEVPPEKRRVRLAALDTFDGALWTSAGEFRRSGTRLPQDLPIPGPTATVRMEVQVIAPTGDFLPVLGQPSSASGLATAVDSRSGTLVGLEPPGAGDSYTIEADIPARTDVEAAAPGTGVPDAAVLVDAPEWVATAAQDIVELRPPEDSDTAWEQLRLLETWYQSRAYNSEGRPGHSYASLYRTLNDATDNGAGHVEQYATGFAVLARALGYSTRVAVGYRLAEEKLDGQGWYSVSSAEADAWPEVWLDGFGWVAFDPTNEANSVSDPESEPPAPPTEDDGDSEVVPPEQADDADQGADETDTGTRLSTTEVIAWGLVVLLALLLLLLLLQVAAVVTKIVRRAYRRGHGTPARRVGAAWSETRDRLLELSYDAPASATPGEVAALTAQGPAAGAHHHVTELAVIATAAVYAPDVPQEPAAERAWELEGDVRAELAKGTPLGRRVLAFLDPRAVLRRSGVPRERPGPTVAAGSADGGAVEPAAVGAGTPSGDAVSGGPGSDGAGPGGARSDNSAGSGPSVDRPSGGASPAT